MIRLLVAFAIALLPASMCVASDTPSLLAFSTGIGCDGSRLVRAFGVGSIDSKLLIYRGCEHSVFDVPPHVVIPLIYAALLVVLFSFILWIATRQSVFSKAPRTPA